MTSVSGAAKSVQERSSGSDRPATGHSSERQPAEISAGLIESGRRRIEAIEDRLAAELAAERLCGEDAEEFVPWSEAKKELGLA